MIIKLELLRYFRFNFIFLLNFDFKSSEILFDLKILFHLKSILCKVKRGEYWMKHPDLSFHPLGNGWKFSSSLRLSSFPAWKKEKYTAIIAKRLKKGSNSNSITGLTWKVVGSLISLG
jgi:hypothetical protein